MPVNRLRPGRADTPWMFTSTGAELDANALLAAAKAAISEALADCPPGPIAGVGVASLAEAGVLLGSRGEPVAPVIAWHDTRDHAQLADLLRTITAHDFSAMTGLPARQQWSLTKHRWLLDNMPEARRAVRRLNVAEWIVRGLGGEEATEQSLASRTGWLRLAQRSWWSDTLEWSGASQDLMPPLVTAGTPLGRVSADAEIPRLTGAVLTLAGHDHQAAVIGAGADGPGDELDSCGTAEALVRTIAPGLSPLVVAELADAGITTGWHAVADHWCLLGATQGGLALQRIMGLLGKDKADLPALDLAALALPTPTLRGPGAAVRQARRPRSRRRRRARPPVARRLGNSHRAGRPHSRCDERREWRTRDAGGHRRLVAQPGPDRGQTPAPRRSRPSRRQRGRSPRGSPARRARRQRRRTR